MDHRIYWVRKDAGRQPAVCHRTESEYDSVPFMMLHRHLKINGKTITLVCIRLERFGTEIKPCLGVNLLGTRHPCYQLIFCV